MKWLADALRLSAIVGDVTDALRLLVTSPTTARFNAMIEALRAFPPTQQSQ